MRIFSKVFFRPSTIASSLRWLSASMFSKSITPATVQPQSLMGMKYPMCLPPEPPSDSGHRNTAESPRAPSSSARMDSTSGLPFRSRMPPSDAFAKVGSLAASTEPVSSKTNMRPFPKPKERTQRSASARASFSVNSPRPFSSL